VVDYDKQQFISYTLDNDIFVIQENLMRTASLIKDICGDRYSACNWFCTFLEQLCTQYFSVGPDSVKFRNGFLDTF